jgi:coproporphyrinogen III oxidase-like Fe-S oxidoreductase
MTDILKADIKTAIAQGLDGVELGQMYPFKNELERIVKMRNLRLPYDGEVIEMIELATDMLLEAGYVQSTYSGFTRQGKIILETAYFGGIEEMPDCIAMGSGAFGSICGFKYRNASYGVYMSQNTPCYGQLKEMTQEQVENMQIVGFPKVLVLNKGLLQKEGVWERFRTKFESLQGDGYIAENENSFYLTKKGKRYIDNIYWYLLEETEKEVLKNDITIYVSEVA